MTWSNQPDDLGNDVLVTYTASSPSGEVSGQTRIKGAAVLDPTRRDAWILPARNLFEFLRRQKLI